MSSVNKQILVGNLGQDPDVRYTQDGKCVTSFSVATSDVWKDKNGEKQEKTEWHRVVAFGKLGQVCGEYLGKGSKVYVEGPTESNKWTDKDGVERTTKQVKAREIKFLSTKGGSMDENVDPPAQDDIDDDIPF